MQGVALKQGPWFNLSLQSMQPLFQRAERVQVRLTATDDAAAAAVHVDTLEATLSPELAFAGGSCLLLKGGT